MELIYYDGFLFKNKSNVFSIVVEEPEALYGTSQPWRELGVTKELYEERLSQIQSLTLMDNKLLIKVFDDGTHIIYVNAEINDDTELGRLMHDLKCERVEDMDNKVLANRVDYYKNKTRGIYEWWDDIDEWSLRDIEKGKKQGEQLGLITLICKKLVKGKDIATIALELESEYDEIASICEIAQDFAPEYDIDAIFEAYSKTQVVA